MLIKINNGVADQKNAFADQKNNSADHFTNSRKFYDPIKISSLAFFLKKFLWKKFNFFFLFLHFFIIWFETCNAILRRISYLNNSKGANSARFTNFKPIFYVLEGWRILNFGFLAWKYHGIMSFEIVRRHCSIYLYRSTFNEINQQSEIKIPMT